MWKILSTQDDGSWLDDYISHVITHECPPLPPHDQKVGHVEVHWHQVEAGVCHVVANPDTGSLDDRLLVEAMVTQQLQGHGFKRATVSLRWDHSDMTKVAEWSDIEDKARRLVQSGAVTMKTNTANVIASSVQGDNGNYDVEIKRDSPDTNEITGSHCTCDWGQFQNLPRTRQWKRFQNRPCAHILATWWQAGPMPNDEDRAPGNQGEPGQMSLFDMSGQAPNPNSGIMRKSPMPNPNAWFMQPGAPPNQFNQQQAPPMGQQQAPSPAEVLPQFPMDPSLQPQLPPVNPASIPGGRPGPTPTNPLQYPGGTFSSIRSDSMQHMADQQYQNGDLVRLRQETVATLVGRSEEHGAGQQTTLPSGSVGEVLGTDPTTQMVNVLFMGKQFNTNSYFEPYGATAWCWPSELQPSQNRPPGPAIRRT